MKTRQLLILGGTGFLGHHLLPRLSDEGHHVTVLTRNREQHRELGILPRVRLVNADVHQQSTLERHFAGADAVINLVGILNESGQQSFHRVHVELTRKVLDACTASGVRQLLQMSSLKAGQGRSRYLKTRGEAEDLVRQSPLAWTIFQPSVIFGPGDGLVTRFAALLKFLPVLPLARPTARMAPVFVADVAAAIQRCLQRRDSSGKVYELYGPDVYTLLELVRMIRDDMGVHRLVVGLPDSLGRMQAMAGEWLPGKPISRDNFLSLLSDSVGSNDGLGALGITAQRLPPLLPWLLGRGSRAEHLDVSRAGNHG